DKRVINFITSNLTDVYGNASSIYDFGNKAKLVVDKAKTNTANIIGSDQNEIYFTSGATESNNLAIKGAAQFYHKKGKHLITCKTEHKATLDTMRALEREGFEVTYLDVEASGLLDLDKLKAAMRPDTTVVSVMFVNNEIGVVQDIAAIGELCRANGTIFHVDSAQAAGKVDIDLQALKVDLMSFSAHKIYGPKGIGALFVRRKPRIRLEAQTHGGGHERGMRSGTLPTHQIVAMGEAFRIAKLEMAEENARFATLRQRLWDGIQDIEQVFLNGDADKRVPGITNISFNYVEGESLIMALKDIAVSSGSACTSASLEPSYVLRALGLTDELAHSSIRFSIGRFTTEEQIDHTIKIVHEAIDKLRAMSPLWDMYKDGVDLNTVAWVAH
ncbi:MAG: IscS subfamily cysteine desulfurase, partial [Rheinheimera sp.]